MPTIKTENINWNTITDSLLNHGFAKAGPVLSKTSCEKLISQYDNDIYRSVINMQRYNFGRGEYKYYAYPLPGLVTELRSYFYENLTPVAREWSKRLRLQNNYPKTHDDYINKCHAADQKRPTPLILKYGPEDFNTLHQDLYGEIHFPYQAAIMLSRPDQYRGGEFTLIEQRPRMQSVAHVQNLIQGEVIIFAVNEFPKLGKKGYYRATLRHGVSKLHSGSRHTLGIILHDAK